MSDCWIFTASGRRVDLLDPQPEMFCLEDIVHSLVKTCRFVGQCSRFYSVAEHSWIGSQQMSTRGLQVEFQLHDGTEAYLGDLSHPLKCVLPEYKLIEARMDHAIRLRFGLPLICSREVKVMDLRMLATERRDLMPADGEEWDCLRGVEPIEVDARGWKMNLSGFDGTLHPELVGSLLLSSLSRWDRGIC